MIRLLTVALFLALTAISASAYTIVMRDGRRVEIPNEFTVTSSTVTYDVGSGIQITIQLNAVDVAATERANGEAKGSFLLKSRAPKVVVSDRGAQTRPRAERSITNKELEGYRRVRLESEKAYEKRRRELGLPSTEDRRREIAAIEERTQQQLREMRGQEEEDEAYWRSRAEPLRAEIAATDAQIDFVRRRLDEIPLTSSFGAFTTVVPFGTVGFPVNGGPFTRFPFPQFPTTLTTPVIRQFPVTPTPLITGTGFQGGSHRMMRDHRGFNRFSRGNFAQGSLLALPFQSYDYSLERSVLANQLNELLMQQAALKARWRALEDEARRAGAYPGWLR